MDEKAVLSRVVVYHPDPRALTPDTFKKPFILYFELRCGSGIMGVTPLPNVLDLLGMPSGGGPPGFTVLESRRYSGTSTRFIMGLLPGAEFVESDGVFELGAHIGTCISMGLVVNYLELRGAKSLEDKEGYVLVPLIEYETPEVLLRGMAVHAPKATEG
jgi:hypothetical protein